MSIIIIPREAFYGAGAASGEGHTHNNLTTLNKLSTDNYGNLRFDGNLAGEKAIESSLNVTLTDSLVKQKFISLPHDCDTSRVITLSLNGVAFSQEDFWRIRESSNSSEIDFIDWEGLGLENFAMAGDKMLITYYRKL